MAVQKMLLLLGCFSMLLTNEEQCVLMKLSLLSVETVRECVYSLSVPERLAVDDQVAMAQQVQLVYWDR